MARKKKTEDEIVAEIASEIPAITIDPLEDPKSSIKEKDGNQAKRISIKLSEDGSIDVGSLRASTKKEFRDAVAATMRNPEAAREAGLAGAGEVRLKVDPDFCKYIYVVLGKVDSALAAKFAGLDKDIADRCFTFSPEQAEALAKPTAIVASKYMPESLSRYQEEFQLLGMLAMILSEQATTAKILQSERNKEKEESRDRRAYVGEPR